MMEKDEIVAEVRRIRDAYAAQFDYDMGRMFEDLKDKESKESAPRATLQPAKLRRDRG
ncbi:MAG: hypothetical protein ACRD3E_11420 [Terriglobales bacterium]